MTTVGASYGPSAFMTSLQLRASDGATLSLPGSTITRGVAGRTVVSAADVAGYGDPLCSTPMDPGSVTNLVVVCERGTVTRIEKSLDVRRGGAAGMILYNPSHQDLFTDNFWVPTVMLEGPEPANTLLSFLDAHAQVRATWATGAPTPIHADQMTTFSSRGPAGGSIKPDVTAPGLQVLAGDTPDPVDDAFGPPGQLFQSIAGTSMSSPYAAGVAALILAVHPSWTPGQVKSALMTSALQTATKEDGVTPADPFDDGAGSIRADRAVQPTLTFDVPASDFVAAEHDPRGWLDLNLPSIDAMQMPRRDRHVALRPEREQIADRRSRRPLSRPRARRSSSRRPTGASRPAQRWRSTSRSSVRRSPTASTSAASRSTRRRGPTRSPSRWRSSKTSG